MSKKKKQSDPSGSFSTERLSRPAGASNLRAEGTEPWAENRPIPMILVILLVLLFFASDIFLMANRGEFDARVYEPHPDFAAVESLNPPDPVKIERLKGKRVYETCAACHQGNGLGLPGQFPPLAGSDWVLADGPERVIRLVLSGIQGPITVSGQSFNGAMVGWGPVFKDHEIAAVLTYIRSEWGNKASAVTAKEVEAIRSQVADRDPWKPEDLLKVPLK